MTKDETTRNRKIARWIRALESGAEAIAVSADIAALQFAAVMRTRDRG